MRAAAEVRAAAAALLALSDDVPSVRGAIARIILPPLVWIGALVGGAAAEALAAFCPHVSLGRFHDGCSAVVEAPARRDAASRRERHARIDSKKGIKI